MQILDTINEFLYSRKHGTAENSKGKASDATLMNYGYALRIFSSYMVEQADRHSYESITSANIRAFVEWATAQTNRAVKPWSMSKYILLFKTLKVYFHWIEQDEDCIEAGLKSWRAKLPKLSATPKREQIATPKELKTWQGAFKTDTVLGLRNWMIFSLFMETGMRRGELAYLKVEHIQIDNRLIYISDGKTGSRTVAMSERLANDMRNYLKRRRKIRGADSPYLFPSCKAGHQPSADMISKAFSRMQHSLGLPHLTPHGLRHAFCTYWIKNGGNVEMLRNVTGHKTYSAMQHYMHLAKVGGEAQKAELNRVSPLRMLDRVR